MSKRRKKRQGWLCLGCGTWMDAKYYSPERLYCYRGGCKKIAAAVRRARRMMRYAHSDNIDRIVEDATAYLGYYIKSDGMKRRVKERIMSPVPMLLCDDETLWVTTWRNYSNERVKQAHESGNRM